MKVLIVVDMQNDFITGSLGTPEAQAIVPNVKKKIAEYAKNSYPIICTRDTHYEDYLDTMEGKKLPVKHCIKDSWGWQISNDIFDEDVPILHMVINKHTFGYRDLAYNIWCYINDAYPDHDYDVEEIELVGLCTDICVVSNALLLKAAFYETCEISVDATCCAGVTPETHEAALKTMEMCQINVKR